MEKWVTVLFHMRNAILNKKMPNKEIFTKYSYFLVELCTTWSVSSLMKVPVLHTAVDLSHTREAMYAQT